MSDSDITIGTTVFLVNRVNGPRRLCRGVVDRFDGHTGKKHAHIQWDSPVKCSSYKPVSILTSSAIVAISSRNDLDPEEIGRIIEDAKQRGLLPAD